MPSPPYSTLSSSSPLFHSPFIFSVLGVDPKTLYRPGHVLSLGCTSTCLCFVFMHSRVFACVSIITDTTTGMSFASTRLQQFLSAIVMLGHFSDTPNWRYKLSPPHSLLSAFPYQQRIFCLLTLGLQPQDSHYPLLTLIVCPSIHLCLLAHV